MRQVIVSPDSRRPGDGAMAVAPGASSRRRWRWPRCARTAEGDVVPEPHTPCGSVSVPSRAPPRSGGRVRARACPERSEGVRAARRPSVRRPLRGSILARRVRAASAAPALGRRGGRRGGVARRRRVGRDRSAGRARPPPRGRDGGPGSGVAPRSGAARCRAAAGVDRPSAVAQRPRGGRAARPRPGGAAPRRAGGAARSDSIRRPRRRSAQLACQVRPRCPSVVVPAGRRRAGATAGARPGKTLGTFWPRIPPIWG